MQDCSHLLVSLGRLAQEQHMGTWLAPGGEMSYLQFASGTKAPLVNLGVLILPNASSDWAERAPSFGAMNGAYANVRVTQGTVPMQRSAQEYCTVVLYTAIHQSSMHGTSAAMLHRLGHAIALRVTTVSRPKQTIYRLTFILQWSKSLGIWSALMCTTWVCHISMVANAR